LFDINQLFQDAVGRFLTAWLSDADVSQQHRLIDVFRYHPQFNPRHKRTPNPRPDYVMLRSGGIVAIADAKYRDLWEHDLPPEMLYQLSIYALSQLECQTASPFTFPRSTLRVGRR
jgi:5-methylcytosine-specific restriction enzyme subunit McrC